MKRKSISPFSLSFLDIMFCGFGAVVLLVLILNNDTVKARKQTFADLRAEVVKLEKEAITGRENLVIARNSLQATDQELVQTQGESAQILKTIKVLKTEIAAMNRETLADREHISQLTSDLKSLDKEKKRQGAAHSDASDKGSKVREFKGQGDRQYLTGLKMGGKRILILVDSSASMLDETIINIVRLRNMDAASKRNASKWKRTLATSEWLASQLPATAHFQLYSFNTTANAALSGSAGKWLKASNRQDLERAINALRQTLPQGGTSLYKAFAAAKALSPRPDNILLVTDGLPTQGRSKPSSTTVSAEQRLKHFETAVRALPNSVPVNTILLPMEGDAYAAAAFWKLAIDTNGSFMTPARDWP
jgi:von Willebrand factor type A domain